MLTRVEANFLSAMMIETGLMITAVIKGTRVKRLLGLLTVFGMIIVIRVEWLAIRPRLAELESIWLSFIRIPLRGNVRM